MGLITNLLTGGATGGSGGLAGGLIKKMKNKSAGKSDASSSQFQSSSPDVYHKGGRVRRTGLARLKKNEQVLTPKQARKYRSKMRSSK